MSIQILRRGSQGKFVERWQTFLVGLRFLHFAVDGDFGPRTEEASKAFQRSQGLSADGIVGPQTIGKAILLGFDAGFSDPDQGDAEDLLPGNAVLKPATAATRIRLFGEFDFEPDPRPGNREAINIIGDWEKQNIVTVYIPQLEGISVFGKRSSGRMRFHRLAVEQLKAMWAAWEDAGVLRTVLTYDGSFNARFIRGSRTTLSNHAFGSAFDINARWNPLGAIPVAMGREGSVRELVAIANQFGFFWGGHFKGRPDGMHFEVAKLL
ncbi:M15 family metallopeptidase [Marinobacterium lutimaris]|uniref:Peptidoglycan-binding (PGRP) domain of peptidoglycan hydrolases-containing protein n=1 Tax=Marinobacterium lutimaris TaxID=568106 RepID=A0A1H5XHR0_9GAMM|nr:M15 family metallopeptidase [Marinobacterium lutimaris]SEG11262.1 Peptidoglycan-binding (PGRP) domain of peptidoglycan hydrolases-containing protein [Marinobacterium lutimaris]